MKVSTLAKAQNFARSGFLFAPASFKTATIDELMEICNNCGASGSWFKAPSKIYGTDISACCNIHDYQYHYGATIEDKWEADRIFHNNLLRIIDDACKSHWYKPRWLMRIRARVYYLAVKECGGPAFFAGKN